MAFDIEKIRADFPLLGKRVKGKQIAYLDNAATTQKPRAVLDAMRDYYENENANAGRGGHLMSIEAAERLERARRKVAAFIGAHPGEIVFTRNATESLNFAARMACQNAAPGRTVLLTEMEHHSNIVNWQLVARECGARLDFAKMRSHGKLCIADFEKKLGKGPFAASFTHASNVLGTVNDAAKIAKLAKRAGALVIVDGAQSVPHVKVDVHSIGCDFFAFSAHKMMGPTGLGVLYIRKEIADSIEPVFGGGGMISSVRTDGSDWARAPQKFEPGTQDVAGAVGFEAAIEYIGKLGAGAARKQGEKCHKAFVKSLREVKGAKIYGNGRETGIASFNVGMIHAHDVAEFASQDGIMVRAGHHCAEPLMAALGVPATVRASFYLYNTEEEAERLALSVRRAVKRLG